MDRRWPYLALTIGVLCCVHLPARAELSLDVQADRTDILSGEAITLMITVHGTQNASPPDLSAVRDCTVTVHSPSRNIVLLNGVPRQWIAYAVEITPLRTGELVAGPIRVDAEGQVLTSPGPTIRVRDTEDRSLAFVNVSASRHEVLVGEPFEIEVQIGLRQLADPYAQHDPIDVRDPPHLDVPFLRTPATGLDNPELQAYLQSRVQQRLNQPGFMLNDISLNVDPMMNFMNTGEMSDRVPARFTFPRQTEQTREGSFQVYSMNLAYRANKEGDYTFGPVSLKGRPITSVSLGGQITTTPALASGAAITVRAVSPPEAGRPPSFFGAIGSNLTVTASLDAQTCQVGDPLTLSIDLAGDISMENLSPPVLADVPGLAENFRVYADSVRTTSIPNGKRYRYTLRTTQAGTYELPPIPVSYFDRNDRTYHTLRTAPIPIRANASAEVAGGMILSAATNAATRVSFSRSGADRMPAPMTMDPAGATTVTLFSWERLGPVALAGPAVLALTLLGRGLRRVAQRRGKSARPRGAARAASAALAEAARAASGPQQNALIRAALARYLMDRFHAPGQGMTPDEVRQLLASHPELPAGLAAECHTLYARLFHAQFAPGATHAPDGATLDSARRLLRDFEAQRRARQPRTAPAPAPREGQP